MTTPKNPHAVALGRLGGQKPKNYSDAEKELRRGRLALARAKKVANKSNKSLSDAADGLIT